MTFFTFLAISLLITLGIRLNQIKENLVPYVLIALYATSILPSLQIPYIIDDMDHLFQLSQAMESSQVTRWLFTPHNEHAIPFLKFLYYIFYKNFWLYPQPFHLVITAVCTGTLCLAYHLLWRLTNSKYSAFLGTALLASTNLPDLAIYVITNSHIIFCLFFILLLFFSQYQYLHSRKKLWAVFIILSTVLAPSTFSLGATSLVFAFLFEWLCIPKNLKKTNGSTMPLVFAGWAVGLLPYLFSLKKIIYADQYRYVNASSSFEVMNIWVGTKLLTLYFCQNLIPELLPGFYLSIGLFFFAIAIGIKYKSTVEWKKIAFFLISGFTFSFIIYIFRAAWGPLPLSVSRYDVFPSLMICMVYAILVTPFLKEKEPILNNRKYHFLVYLAAFVLVSYSGMLRYNRANLVAYETGMTVQKFNIDFKTAVTGYFKENPTRQEVAIKDTIFSFPKAFSLLTRKGFSPDVSRYPRPLSFYRQYVLPADLRNKITFGPSTDPDFLAYLLQPRHEDAYAVLIPLIQ